MQLKRMTKNDNPRSKLLKVVVDLRDRMNKLIGSNISCSYSEAKIFKSWKITDSAIKKCTTKELTGMISTIKVRIGILENAKND